jgi:hypothetical protein
MTTRARTTRRVVPPAENDPPPQATEPGRTPRARRIRRSPNAWWCPDDDRAMQIKDPPLPCDVCGKSLSDF